MMGALVDHLWQSTLFVFFAWLIALTLRNNAARIRYWVWLAASIKFLVPFSLLTALGNQFSWRVESQPAAVGFINVMQTVAQPLGTPNVALQGVEAGSIDFMLALAALWVAGSLLLLFRWGRSLLGIIAAIRKGSTVAIAAPIPVK